MHLIFFAIVLAAVAGCDAVTVKPLVESDPAEPHAASKPMFEADEFVRDLWQQRLVPAVSAAAVELRQGIALQQKDKQVFCLDGDGAVLMHMGGLASIGTSGCTQYKHICLNNGAHDSVGGQPTVAFEVDLAKVASACGYPAVFTVTSPEEIAETFPRFLAASGPAFLEVRVKVGHRDNLGRPKMAPGELKVAFMKALAEV